jgi:glyoxylase-like metal-dependent hydrolase (beta-lactamase superfamily II)
LQPKLRQLSESLFVAADTCNVYLVRSGNAGLLIDAGSGSVAEVLGEVGVGEVEWILHTHHHRDQCWGTPRLVAAYGAKVAAPEYERYYLESAQDHWAGKRIFDNYANSSTFFTPGADIAVDASLEDYESFTWRDFEFSVIPAQGHTFGSGALIVEIDGRRVAFTGDLICAGGLAYQLHSLEYGYGDLAGVTFTLQSVQALMRQELDLILPSHGKAIEDPPGDLARLKARLTDIARLGTGIEAGAEGWAGVPASQALPETPLIEVSEHLLWSGPWTCSSFYVILSGSGEAVLIDYGHAHEVNIDVGLEQQSEQAMRFVVHHLDELRERFGVEKIEAVAVTHIHDDHTCGIPYLQRHLGVECWALDEVAKVLENPADWASTPCTLSKPIKVQRKFADGEKVRWRGLELTFHFAPGQTEFHSVISAEIDGRVVAFAGDNYFSGRVDVGGKLVERPFQTTVFRNSFQLAMHRRCVEVMREISPDMICPGHGAILEGGAAEIERYADYVAQKERAFKNAVAKPADHHLDLFWVRLRPYVSRVQQGEPIEYTLMVRNNLGRPATFAARLLSPSPDRSLPADLVSIDLGCEESGEITLTLADPPSLPTGRALVTAEVLIDGYSQGPIAEALLFGRPSGESTSALQPAQCVSIEALHDELRGLEVLDHRIPS